MIGAEVYHNLKSVIKKKYGQDPRDPSSIMLVMTTVILLRI